MKEKALLSADIDRFGDLDKKLAPFKSDISAREALRKLIVARFESEPADQPCTGEGERWVVKLTPKTMRRIYKPGALKRLATFLGDAFYRIAQVPLGEFDDHVTIENRSKYVEEQQIGHRSIEVMAKTMQNAA